MPGAAAPGLALRPMLLKRGVTAKDVLAAPSDKVALGKVPFVLIKRFVVTRAVTLASPAWSRVLFTSGDWSREKATSIAR